MSRRTLVPRLRLLGLLLICASIIMGLLLSAAGVQSVNLSSPFAKDIAERVQTASDESMWIGNSSPTYVSTHSQTAGEYTDANFRHHPKQYSDSVVSGDGSRLGELPGQSSNQASQADKPFTVSLWALVAPICIIGFVLWMTPMPAASTSPNRSTRRR